MTGPDGNLPDWLTGDPIDVLYPGDDLILPEDFVAGTLEVSTLIEPDIEEVIAGLEDPPTTPDPDNP